VRALAAFDRVHLDAGQSQDISLHIPLRRLECWSSAESRWIKPLSPREVAVGGSSRDLPLTATISIH
jgi:beta-glucosidase